MNLNVAEVEKDALERLRVKFEAEGYKFLAEPNTDDLPDFLQRRRPDAIAISPTETVVIEAKSFRTKASELPLTHLAREISSRPGWRLLVVYAGEDSVAAVHLSRPEKFEIDLAIDQARAFDRAGSNRYGIVVAWSIFEALTRRLYGENTATLSRALSAVEIVERLAMDGYVDFDEAQRLRGLISARNRSVHGDLRIEIADADIAFMLDKAHELNQMTALDASATTSGT